MTLLLVNLDCPSCGSALKGEHNDILFICTHCSTGAFIGDTGLEQINTTALLPTPGRHATSWRPAWLLETTVKIDQRWVAGSPPSGAAHYQRSFIIPAFDLPFSDLTTLTQALIRAESSVAEVPHEPIRGGTLSLADAETFIRHIVVGEEVHKSDMLISVMVDITINSHRLAALPFEKKGEQLACAVTGTKI